MLERARRQVAHGAGRPVGLTDPGGTCLIEPGGRAERARRPMRLEPGGQCLTSPAANGSPSPGIMAWSRAANGCRSPAASGRTSLAANASPSDCGSWPANGSHSGSGCIACGVNTSGRGWRRASALPRRSDRRRRHHRDEAGGLRHLADLEDRDIADLGGVVARELLLDERALRLDIDVGVDEIGLIEADGAGG